MYYLKVNYIINYKNKKEITNYELYENNNFLKSYEKENVQEINKLLKKYNIKAKKDGFNYIIDDQKFISKNFIKKESIINTLKLMKLKKPIIISSIALASILSISTLKTNKNNTPINNVVASSDEDFFEEKLDNNINTIEKNISIDKSNNIDFSYNDVNDNISTFTFNKDDISNLDYATKFLDTYNNCINENCSNYGLDSNLISASIATENKFLERNNSGYGGHGIMQIEHIWDGKELTAYNFQTQSYETIIVDLNKANYDDEYCIKVGCMILNQYYNYFYKKYGDKMDDKECLMISLFAYNKGIGNTDKAITNSYDSNCDRYMFDNACDYLKQLNCGNDNYLEDVLSGIPDKTIINTKTYDNINHKIQIDNLSINNMTL